MKITQELIKKRFPQSIKFSFLSNFVNKPKETINKETPLDLVLITEDSKKFHIDNYKMNKKDYPLISKIFSIRLINFTQKRGARIHYNSFKTEDNNIVRYSIIDWNDFEYDMLHWKYLTASCFMQKPFEVITNDDKELIDEYQESNIKTTISFVILTLLNTNISDSLTIIDEKDFYRKVLSIPLRKSRFNKYFNLANNNYNVEEILSDQIDELRVMYTAYIQELSNLGVVYDTEKNTISIKNSIKLREVLFEMLPTNLISGVVVEDDDIILEKEREKEIDNNKVKVKTNIFSKISIKNLKKLDDIKEKYNDKVRQYFINNYTVYKQQIIQKQVDRIMNQHKNSRVYLILMSKYFFICFWLIKLMIKISIIFYLYKKHGNVHIPFISNINKNKNI